MNISPIKSIRAVLKCGIIYDLCELANSVLVTSQKDAHTIMLINERLRSASKNTYTPNCCLWSDLSWAIHQLITIAPQLASRISSTVNKLQEYQVYLTDLPNTGSLFSWRPRIHSQEQLKQAFVIR